MTTLLPVCETLLLERSGSTLFLTLNRPHVRNAINSRMWDEIEGVFSAIAPDRSIKVVVLRGAAGVFCAGGDISERSSLRDIDTGEHDPVALRNRRAGRVFSQIDSAPQAVVAVVESYALGGGFGLACVADITIAAADVKFGLPEVTLGLVPAQILPFLFRRIGSAELRRLALTAARIGADEALRIGLVHEVCADASALEERLSQTLAHLERGAPIAIATAKQVIAMARDLPDETLLDTTSQVLARLVRSPEGIEGAMAFKEKRTPNWQTPRS
ncbi:MAG TPA: enoyl-CoA hydratase-related protein [Candidimonas sp.]|nr:enoyl-CoA hydratase-related protein [Candidimonas sp.]